ncbi:zf-TFIIB domain-containing protein [Seongchinamella sediminis]|nr:zf-TFIIB domain-containing protein [Seongchinamella sediminis]
MEHNPEQHSLKCPKCHHGMVEVEHSDVVIDRCTNCHGLWFDADEAHQLKQLPESHAVDIGDPKEGWKWDSRVEIDCPRCNKRMELTADAKQKHIWYEVCHDHGMFMDAGEFADFKEESLLDWFRGVIKGDRATVCP